MATSITVQEWKNHYRHDRCRAVNELAELCCELARSVPSLHHELSEDVVQDVLLRQLETDFVWLLSIEHGGRLRSVMAIFMVNRMRNLRSSERKRREFLARVGREKPRAVYGLPDTGVPQGASAPGCGESVLVNSVGERLRGVGWTGREAMAGNSPPGSNLANQMATLAIKGASIHAISRALGCDRKTVREKLKKMLHAPPPPPQGAT